MTQVCTSVMYPAQSRHTSENHLLPTTAKRASWSHRPELFCCQCGVVGLGTYKWVPADSITSNIGRLHNLRVLKCGTSNTWAYFCDFNWSAKYELVPQIRAKPQIYLKSKVELGCDVAEPSCKTRKPRGWRWQHHESFLLWDCWLKIVLGKRTAIIFAILK